MDTAAQAATRFGQQLRGFMSQMKRKDANFAVIEQGLETLRSEVSAFANSGNTGDLFDEFEELEMVVTEAYALASAENLEGYL